MRLDEVSGTLSALEIEDLVTVRDAVAVGQRLEMVRRIADEIAGYVVELGTDGRLLALQLEELMAGVEADRTLVIRDYLPNGRRTRVPDDALDALDTLSATHLIDLVAVAKALGYPGASDAMDAAVSPRACRLLVHALRESRERHCHSVEGVGLHVGERRAGRVGVAARLPDARQGTAHSRRD